MNSPAKNAKQELVLPGSVGYSAAAKAMRVSKISSEFSQTLQASDSLSRTSSTALVVIPPAGPLKVVGPPSQEVMAILEEEVRPGLGEETKKQLFQRRHQIIMELVALEQMAEKARKLIVFIDKQIR